MHHPIELLHWCGMPGDHVSRVSNILEDSPKFVDTTNKYGDNALFIAIRSGNIDIANYLIDGNFFNLSNICLSKNMQPDGNVLIHSLLNNLYELSYKLLSRDINLFYTYDHKCITPLHIILENNKYDFFEKPFAKNISYNVYAKNSSGITIADSMVRGYIQAPALSLLTYEYLLSLLNPLQKNHLNNSILEYFSKNKINNCEPLLNCLNLNLN